MLGFGFRFRVEDFLVEGVSGVGLRWGVKNPSPPAPLACNPALATQTILYRGLGFLSCWHATGANRVSFEAAKGADRAKSGLL